MKRLSLILITIFISLSLFAQYQKGYVYLKNGTILKGKFRYSNDFKKLNVETAGNIWVFEAAEVDSVFPKPTKNEDLLKPVDSDIYFRTDIGLLAGNSDNVKSAPLSFTSSVNYIVTGNLAAGAGVGVEFLDESYLPVFVNVEYKLRNTASTPYFYLMAGYQVPLEDSQNYYYDYYPAWNSIWPGPYYSDKLDPKGGVLLNPGLGYMHMFSEEFGMSVAFGYRYHRLHYKGENDYSLDVDYNRLSIKFGIIFK